MSRLVWTSSMRRLRSMPELIDVVDMNAACAAAEAAAYNAMKPPTMIRTDGFTDQFNVLVWRPRRIRPGYWETVAIYMADEK